MTKETFAKVLSEAATAAGWKATRIGATVNKGEQSARQWLKGEAAIAAHDAVTLMAYMPGLKARVLALIESFERNAA